jgi:hypothetical protein
MAVFALFSHSAFVRIVLFMAINTAVLGQAVKPLFFVATFTRYGNVVAAQFEIGTVVIEGFFIQLHDVHIAAFVFGMTGMAFPVRNIVYMAMKSGVCFDVVVDFLVTFAAQFLLLGFIERLVALFTFFFKPCMPLNEISRLDQAFHALHGIFRVGIGSIYD